jgi:hypothetical protein
MIFGDLSSYYECANGWIFYFCLSLISEVQSECIKLATKVHFLCKAARMC